MDPTPQDPPIVQPKLKVIGRALVVDDDRGMQHLLSRVLGMEGLEVDQASDGQEGLRRAMAASYQVVLLDLQLPKLDGMTVLRRLRSTRPKQPVIVSSCQSDLGTRAACLRAGAWGFLAKPFSLVELLTSVAGACAASRGGTP
jgi:DNA-binding response OmpR family regulator